MTEYEMNQAVEAFKISQADAETTSGIGLPEEAEDRSYLGLIVVGAAIGAVVTVVYLIV